MFTFATVSLPANSPASSSSAGPIILHGPHHSAQKSTSTGPLLLASTTSVAKLWSVTGLVFALMTRLVVFGAGKVGRAQAPVKFPARGWRSGSTGAGRMAVQQVVGQHHHMRLARPDQRAPHRAAREDAAQQGAIARQLPEVQHWRVLDRLGRLAVALEVGDHDPV